MTKTADIVWVFALRPLRESSIVAARLSLSLGLGMMAGRAHGGAVSVDCHTVFLRWCEWRVQHVKFMLHF